MHRFYCLILIALIIACTAGSLWSDAPSDVPGSTMQLAHGRATIYTPSDAGPERADGRPFTATDAHVAHRSLPLGTRGVLCNQRTKRCVRTSVRDRGPFGALLPCGRDQARPGPDQAAGLTAPKQIPWLRRCHWYQVQIKLAPGWKRRGEFDLTLPVARAIGHRAFDHVVFVYESLRPEA